MTDGTSGAAANSQDAEGAVYQRGLDAARHAEMQALISAERAAFVLDATMLQVKAASGLDTVVMIAAAEKARDAFEQHLGAVVVHLQCRRLRIAIENRALSALAPAARG